MFSMSDVILTAAEGKNSYSFIFFCAVVFFQEGDFKDTKI